MDIIEGVSLTTLRRRRASNRFNRTIEPNSSAFNFIVVEHRKWEGNDDCRGRRLFRCTVLQFWGPDVDRSFRRCEAYNPSNNVITYQNDVPGDN